MFFNEFNSYNGTPKNEGAKANVLRLEHKALSAEIRGLGIYAESALCASLSLLELSSAMLKARIEHGVEADVTRLHVAFSPL